MLPRETKAGGYVCIAYMFVHVCAHVYVICSVYTGSSQLTMVQLSLFNFTDNAETISLMQATL